MEKVLIYENTTGITSYAQKHTSIISDLQKIVDQFRAIGVVPTIMEINHIIQAMRQNNLEDKAQLKYVENFIREKLADNIKHPEIGGIKLNRAKFMDMIEVPDCTNLVKVFQKIVYNHQAQDLNYSLYSMLDYQVILPDNSIELIREMEQHRKYATTPDQITAYYWAKDVIESLSKLSIESNLLSILYKDEDGYHINPQKIQNIQ